MNIHFYQVNAIHYATLLDQEKKGPARPKAIEFRQRQLQYYEAEYCRLQGPAPLMELGFTPNNLGFTMPATRLLTQKKQPMSLLNRLPAWKEVIIRSIESCITVEQLHVCQDIIDLFESRYTYLLQGSIKQHCDELWAAYHAKEASISI